MVTIPVEKPKTFTVEIAKLHDGDITVLIRNVRGREKSYRFPEKKLRVFAAIDGPLKDALDFLLGST